MASVEKSAWESSGLFPHDPGLREAYAELKRAPVRLVCLPLAKEVNHGGLLRLAEAFRIEGVDFSPELDGAVDFAGHRGTVAQQPHRWIPADEAIAEAKENQRTVVAVTLNERAVDFTRFNWQFPLALVFGKENEGIDPELESECDASVAIPLYGLVQSLNIATAAAIILSGVIERYRMQDPLFEPARNISRRLMNLPEANYLAQDSSSFQAG